MDLDLASPYVTSLVLDFYVCKIRLIISTLPYKAVLIIKYSIL